MKQSTNTYSPIELTNKSHNPIAINHKAPQEDNKDKRAPIYLPQN